jgi:hypothetical protein
VLEDALPSEHYGVESVGNPNACYGVSLTIRVGANRATKRAIITCGPRFGPRALQARTPADWSVQAGKRFQKAGDYRIGSTSRRLQDAIAAFGKPSACRIKGSSNHAQVEWTNRGIWIDLWTYGGLPEGETGCTSPDLIYVSEIRLTSPRWHTAFGLRVGDSASKLRRLYPRSTYHYSRTGSRSEYWLVTRHSACIGQCSPTEDQHGVDVPQLTAQVVSGRVIAFWIPVFGQGE